MSSELDHSNTSREETTLPYANDMPRLCMDCNANDADSAQALGMFNFLQVQIQ